MSEVWIRWRGDFHLLVLPQSEAGYLNPAPNAAVLAFVCFAQELLEAFQQLKRLSRDEDEYMLSSATTAEPNLFKTARSMRSRGDHLFPSSPPVSADIDTMSLDFRAPREILSLSGAWGGAFLLGWLGSSLDCLEADRGGQTLSACPLLAQHCKEAGLLSVSLPPRFHWKT